MKQTLILYAHPFPSRSVVTKALLAAWTDQPHVTVRNLYQLYPDFDIDVQAEQQALEQADLIIWLTPVHWYSVPALMKHWFDQVLSHGWAYGHGKQALRGKAAWWVASAGAEPHAYEAEGVHGRPFANYAVAVEQIATYCGMHSLPHWVVHGGHRMAVPECTAAAQQLRLQWQHYLEQLPTAQAAATTGEQA